MDEIMQLINGYVENNKYISCLEELYILFENYNLSLEQRTEIMKKVYKYNKKIHMNEVRKAQKLENIENTEESVKEKELPFSKPNTKPPKKVEPLQCDVTEFIKSIKTFTDIHELENILPPRDYDYFDNIIDMLLVNLYQEKVEIINLIHEHQEKDSTIYKYFDHELEDLSFRIDSLLDYKNMETEEEIMSQQKTSNRIVFLKDAFGKPMIFSSLKGYDEYYKSFLELINSIIDGTFKNKRSFLNDNTVVDMMEVRGFQTRVLFSHLKNDIFIIMPAFVKKCDTDLRQKIIIKNTSQAQQMQKGELLNLVDNEEFMKQEEQYLDELIAILGEKKKVNVK